jgi:hypothetical protein
LILPHGGARDPAVFVANTGGSREGAEVLNALHSDGPLYNK